MIDLNNNFLYFYFTSQFDHHRIWIKYECIRDLTFVFIYTLCKALEWLFISCYARIAALRTISWNESVIVDWWWTCRIDNGSRNGLLLLKAGRQAWSRHNIHSRSWVLKCFRRNNLKNLEIHNNRHPDILIKLTNYRNFAFPSL